MMRFFFSAIIVLISIIPQCDKEEKQTNDSDEFSKMFRVAYRLGNAEKILEKIKEIEKRYEEVDDDSEAFHQYHIHLAQLYYGIGEVEKALSIMDFEPSELKLFYRGMLKLKVGRTEEGLSDLREYYTQRLEATQGDEEDSEYAVVMLITKRILGYDIFVSEELDSQWQIITSMTLEELFNSIWPKRPIW